MKYKPSEIATVLEINIDTVYRSYLISGCPHERDEKGNIWIIGTEFKTWAKSEIAERKRKVKEPMKDNQGWCVGCNQRVIMDNPKIVYSGGNRKISQSTCPICGSKVNRVWGNR